MNAQAMLKDLIFSLIALIWSGMILGISFFEAWVKFRTPSLTKEVGLDVGRTVFSAFHFAQCLFLGMLALVFLAQPIWAQGIILLSIFLLLGSQILWVFPKLCSDVDLIRSGKPAQHPRFHLLYGLMEVLKFLSLLLGALYLVFKSI